LPRPHSGCLLNPVHEPVIEPIAQSPETEKATGDLIYVVDDEPMLLELARIILEPLGYNVRTFRDPVTALQAFSAARPRPALLITDYAMHELDGMNLINACRRLAPAQKILLISGAAGPEIYAKAHVKPDRFLAKPYNAKQLAGLVKAILVD
jgi:DNA-binding NtrC family response regulator